MMKTLFLKNMLSIFTIVIAISGAFASSSIKKDIRSLAPAVGYTLDAQGECNIAVACSDIPSSFICRLGGATGPIAYGKDVHGRCVETLWRQF